MNKEALTFDLETGTNTEYKRKASPFCKKNYIVAEGYKYGDGETFGTYHSAKVLTSFPDLQDTKIIIGFNIKFDLLYTWSQPELQEFFRKGGKIWDCQYVEYLIEGMIPQAQMVSMNECIPNYGGTLKLDAVKEMWEAGIDTPDIPQDLLMKYLLGSEEDELEGDVNNTWLIFKGQLARLQNESPNMMKMIHNRMDGLLATTEMEYNGLCIDMELGLELQKKEKEKLETLDAQLLSFIPDLPEELEFNWNSIYHKSYLIYGGLAKYQKWVQHIDEDNNLLYVKKTVKVPMINGNMVGDNDEYFEESLDRYKSGKKIGQIKYKNKKVNDLDKPKGAQKDHYFRFNGFTEPKKSWASESLTDGEDKPIYSTAADTIEWLAGHRNIPFLRMLMQRQKVKKDLGTYYFDEDKNGNRKGMLTLVNEDGIIHHSLNHVLTVTGRLSSSNPNMQNIPKADKSDVKKLFRSRFENGVVAEVDYSQLEVVVQGILSKDKQLIEDLNAGIDFHCKRLAKKLGEDYSEVVRKVKANVMHSSGVSYQELRGGIKSFTFERAYGAGAASIAANNNMDIDEVKELISIEENMYPGVILFDQLVENAINTSRELTHTEAYIAGYKYTLGKGQWIAPTGTKYVWLEEETPKFMQDKGVYTSFSPTQRKNYPVQGTGGEIVQTMLGCLWRWLILQDDLRGKALMTNSVHDCVWLDFENREIADRVLPVVKTILEAVPQKFNKDFNLGITVPFPVEVESGVNMLELTEDHI